MKHVTIIAAAFFALVSARADLPFVVISDWGIPPPRQARTDQREVAVQMGRTAAEIGARFVITAGDNFQAAKNISGADDPLWKTVFEDIYTAPSLQVPWYPAFGNHDYDGSPQGQIDYTKRSKRWRFSSHYYTMTSQVDADATVQFFILDSMPFKRSERTRPDWRAQLAWFERELAASKAKWKIVVAHHPVYSAGTTFTVGGKVHERLVGDTPGMKEHIKPLLEKYGVQMMLCGHEHNFQHLTDGSHVNYFIIGSAAASRVAGKPHRFGKFMQGDTTGFSAIIIKRDAIEVRFVDKTGEVFYKTEVRAQAQ